MPCHDTIAEGVITSIFHIARVRRSRNQCRINLFYACFLYPQWRSISIIRFMCICNRRFSGPHICLFNEIFPLIVGINIGMNCLQNKRLSVLIVDTTVIRVTFERALLVARPCSTSYPAIGIAIVDRLMFFRCCRASRYTILAEIITK